MTVPKLHTFHEALENIDAGGAAYRYGTQYPIYCKSSYGCEIEKRLFGGSSGELLEGYGRETGFSVEEQQSITWVLISPEKWKEREDAIRAGWERIWEENRKKQEETGVFEGKVGQVVPSEETEQKTSKTFWQRLGFTS